MVNQPIWFLSISYSITHSLETLLQFAYIPKRTHSEDRWPVSFCHLPKQQLVGFSKINSNGTGGSSLFLLVKAAEIHTDVLRTAHLTGRPKYQLRDDWLTIIRWDSRYNIEIIKSSTYECSKVGEWVLASDLVQQKLLYFCLKKAMHCFIRFLQFRPFN